MRERTDRRLLATAALIAPASLLPTIAALATGGPDPHPAWWAEWSTLNADLNRRGQPDIEEGDPGVERQVELEELIGTMPAATVAGVAVQLRLVQQYASFGSERDDAALANALATLERLAGESRA